MSIIAKIKQNDPRLGEQTIDYTNGIFTLKSSQDPSFFKNLSLEQVYKLDSAGFIEWYNQNHRAQILSYYEKTLGIEEDKSSFKPITTVQTRSSPIIEFVQKAFQNKLIKISFIAVAVIITLVLGTFLVDFVSYSSKIKESDVISALDKYESSVGDIRNTYNEFNTLYGSRNAVDLRMKAMKKVINESVVFYLDSVDIDGYLESTLKDAEYIENLKEEAYSEESSSPPEIDFEKEKEILSKKSEFYELSGEKRIAAGILFKEIDEYYDNEYYSSTSITRTMAEDMYSDLSVLYSILEKIELEKKDLTKVSDSEFSFTYLNPDEKEVTVYITISKDRINEARIKYIRYEIKEGTDNAPTD